MTEIPGWLQSLVQTVADAVMVHHEESPLGLRYREVDGLWDVLLYLLPMELVGGASDGQVVSPAFTVDVARLLTAFSGAEEFLWNAHGVGSEDGQGPHLSIKGQYQGQPFWLRLLADAPGDVEPGSKLHTTPRPRRSA